MYQSIPIELSKNDIDIMKQTVIITGPVEAESNWGFLRTNQSAYDNALGIAKPIEAIWGTGLLWIEESIAPNKEWKVQPDQGITLIWGTQYGNYSELGQTDTPNTYDIIRSSPGTLKYIKESIGSKLYNSLSKEDKIFLKKASNMFDLGKEVDIFRVLNSLSEDYYEK